MKTSLSDEQLCNDILEMSISKDIIRNNIIDILYDEDAKSPRTAVYIADIIMILSEKNSDMDPTKYPLSSPFGQRVLDEFLNLLNDKIIVQCFDDLPITHQSWYLS